MTKQEKDSIIEGTLKHKMLPFSSSSVDDKCIYQAYKTKEEEYYILREPTQKDTRIDIILVGDRLEIVDEMIYICNRGRPSKELKELRA